MLVSNVCVDEVAKFLVVFLLYYWVDFIPLTYALFDCSILNSLMNFCLKLILFVDIQRFMHREFEFLASLFCSLLSSVS
jgi:hypothetical protein